MIITLNYQQMLDLWRQGAGLEPPLAAASAERFDGIDMNGRLVRAMRAWYVDYLSAAPDGMVPVSDMTEFARIEPGPLPGTWLLTLSCECARIVTVDTYPGGRLRLVDPDDADTLYPLGNRFVRAGNPAVAVHRRGTDTALLYTGSKTEPAVTRVAGVAVTEDDVFTVDERMLAQIPAAASKALDFE